MKKIITILVALFLMASTFCVTTFAEESQSIVMEISGLKNDGKTIVSLNYWTKFADGWECAVDFAEDDDFMEEHGLARNGRIEKKVVAAIKAKGAAVLTNQFAEELVKESEEDETDGEPVTESAEDELMAFINSL